MTIGTTEKLKQKNIILNLTGLLIITGVIKNIQAKTKIKIINVIIIFLDFAVGIGTTIVQASSF